MTERDQLLADLDAATRAGDLELAQLLDQKLATLGKPNLPGPAGLVAGIGEAALQAGTGMASTIGGGLAGLASAAGGNKAPGDLVRKVQQAGTYQPRTGAGEAISRGLGLPMEYYSKGVHALGDVVRGDSSGGPRDLAATTLEVAGEAAPAVLAGAGALKSMRSTATRPPTPKQQVLAEGQQLGLTLPPSLAGRPSIIEGIAGKARTQQLHSTKNVEVGNRVAAKELGLPPDTLLTADTHKLYRKRAYEFGYEPLKSRAQPLLGDDPYWNAIVQLPERSEVIRKSFPDAKIAGSQDTLQLATGMLQDKMSYAGAVERLRQLREEAKTNFRGDSDHVALAWAQREAANALEALIERNLAKTGEQGALTNFRVARTQIAKSHTIEDASNPYTGEVNAAALGRSSAPMTGDLRALAAFGRTFPKAVQNPANFGGTPLISPLDFSMGTIAGLGGAMASGSPWGAAAATAPLMRPLLSPLTRLPAVQRPLARPPFQTPPALGALPLLEPPDRNQLLLGAY